MVEELERLRQENADLKKRCGHLEADLAEAQEQSRKFFHASPHIMTLTTVKEGRMIDLNEAAASLGGYRREELLGQLPLNYSLFVVPDVVGLLSRKLMEEECIRNMEAKVRTKDGEIRTILMSAVPITVNEEPCILGTSIDITEREQTAEALKESEERFRLIADNIDEIFWIVDTEKRLPLYLSPAHERIWGIPTERFFEEPTLTIQMIHPDDRERVIAAIDIIESGQLLDHEYRIIHPDGSIRHLHDRGFPICDKTGRARLYVGVGRDITEKKHLEAQFLQSQKMEAIGLLAGGVAHDFNNLLNVINGYCELILAELEPQSRFRADLEQVKEAGQRASTLTAQLLAFGRKQILKPEILDLNTVITQMDSMLRRMIGEDIELVTLAQPNLRLVNADFVQMQQIIMNLAVNARDAMPQGGKLTIETANVDLDEDYAVQHPLVQPGPYTMLAISDNGMGMDEETRSHLFEPFFTTKQKGKGTGLGLSTVYGIVQQSNGFVWVYSEPGKGTAFKIYFPQTAGTAEAAVEEKAPELVLNGSETVLVVEDEEAVRTLTVRILRDRGYAVLSAADGEEALRLAQAYKAKIHLVLTDVIMPGISGSTLVTRLRISRPRIRSLFISGYTDDAIVHHGILDSGIAFLQKPFSIESLTRKVREVLEP